MARAEIPLMDDETTGPGIEVGPPGGASAPPAPDAQETDAEALRLRADIAHTRENIGSTIEALQQRLNPAALAEQATTAVREATIGKVEDMVHKAEDSIERTGYSLFDTVRENPIPAALAGFGIAWLPDRTAAAARHEGLVPLGTGKWTMPLEVVAFKARANDRRAANALWSALARPAAG